MLSELDRITAIELLKRTVKELGPLRPEVEDVINKTQPECRLFESGMKEVLSRKAMNNMA